MEPNWVKPVAYLGRTKRMRLGSPEGLLENMPLIRRWFITQETDSPTDEEIGHSIRMAGVEIAGPQSAAESAFDTLRCLPQIDPFRSLIHACFDDMEEQIDVGVELPVQGVIQASEEKNLFLIAEHGLGETQHLVPR